MKHVRGIADKGLRAAQIVHMAESGLRPIIISEMTGYSSAYVRSTLSKARKAGITEVSFVRGPRHGHARAGNRLRELDGRDAYRMTMTVPAEVMAGLIAAGKRRRMPATTVARLLLTVAAYEGLIDAILDDGGAA